MTSTAGTQPRGATLDNHPGRRQAGPLRNQRGLSQERLATHAGISLTTLRRLERQPAAACRTRTLGRLAAALNEETARLSPTTPP